MTYPTNVFTYETSMTVSGVEYKLDKATWADRSAWVNNITWPYADNEDNLVTTARLEQTWDKFWHQALAAVFPLEENTNMRAVTAFRINGNIAGFFMNYYCKKDGVVISQADQLRAAIIDSYKGQGHYKYMWALGTANLKSWGHDLHVKQYHDAIGVRKTLSQTAGATHVATNPAPWDSTKTIFEHEWNVNGTEVGTAIESDSRFTTISATTGTSPLTDSRWASPEIQSYLSVLSTPSPTAGL